MTTITKAATPHVRHRDRPRTLTARALKPYWLSVTNRLGDIIVFEDFDDVAQAREHFRQHDQDVHYDACWITLMDCRPDVTMTTMCERAPVGHVEAWFRSRRLVKEP